MRPIPKNGRRIRPARGAAGFALVEVMVAALLSAIFVFGLTGLWSLSASQTQELNMDQKAVFALNGEMERLTALYNLTDFADPNACGGLFLLGLICLGGSGTPGLYPSGGVGAYMPSSSDNFVTTSTSTFRSSDFLVLYVSNFQGAARNFVWVDRARGIAATINWATTDIPQSVNGTSWRGRCWGFGGGSTANFCQFLTLTMKYPYRIDSSGTIQAAANPKTIVLKTIVGRRR